MGRRFDNYPDDIRSYDHDSRSPFYVEPKGEDDEDEEELEYEWEPEEDE